MWVHTMWEDDLPPTRYKSADEHDLGSVVGKGFVTLLWMVAFAALIAFVFFLDGARY